MAALVKNWQGADLPAEWEVRIDCPDLENFWARNLGYGLMARSVASYARERLLPAGQPVILFIENLSTSTLMVMWMALRRVPRDRLALWLLVRFSLRERGWPGRVSRLLLNQLRRQLPPGALQLLTDSVSLRGALERFTGMPFTVLPIPHLDVDAAAARAPFRAGRLICWWPGAPRAEKGLAVMRALTANTGKGMDRLEIVVAAEAGLPSAVRGPRLATQPPGMDRAAYLAALGDCHVVLLPYHAQAYRERTSGIFVEAVAAGKTPLVSAGTWMAGELERHGLETLILDWADAAVGERIWAAAHDAEVAARLRTMQAGYLEQHGEAAFAAALQAIYARQETHAHHT